MLALRLEMVASSSPTPAGNGSKPLPPTTSSAGREISFLFLGVFLAL